MTEEVLESRQELFEPHNITGLDEIQGEWEHDELVNDLQEEWRQHEGKKVDSPKQQATNSIEVDVMQDLDIVMFPN